VRLNRSAAICAGLSAWSAVGATMALRAMKEFG
jgi:hypothetical protein